MTDAANVHTHTAYAFSRQGKKHGRMLECGTGRIDKERNVVHVVMTRTPITGYTGYIVLSPTGAPPPVPQPQRPDGTADDSAEDHAES
jgi:hypothetical protein